MLSPKERKNLGLEYGSIPPCTCDSRRIQYGFIVRYSVCSLRITISDSHLRSIVVVSFCIA